jgi:hypothetical protein
MRDEGRRTGEDHEFSREAEPPVRTQNGDGVDVPMYLRFLGIVLRTVVGVLAVVTEQ